MKEKNTVATAISTLESKRYVRVSEKLAKRSAEVALSVRDKMEELGISDLSVLDVGTLRHQSCKASAGYYDVLKWVNSYGDCPGGDLECGSVGDGETGEYVFGDFSHFNKKPTRDEILRFSLNISAVFAALAKIEDDISAECDKALEIIKK